MATSRREFFNGLSGLVLASTLPPKSVSAPQQAKSSDRIYQVVFEIRDRKYATDFIPNLMESLGYAVTSQDSYGHQKFQYEHSITVADLPERIRKVAHGILQFHGMPDIGKSNAALETLANSLGENPDYLPSEFVFMGAVPEKDGVIHSLGYRTANQEHIGTHIRIGFRAFKKEDGSVQLIQLTDYECFVRDESYIGLIEGKRDFEVFAGSKLNELNNELKVTPFYKDDITTLNEIDLFGHRNRIFNGLKKQNLKFTTDWKPAKK